MRLPESGPRHASTSDDVAPNESDAESSQNESDSSAELAAIHERAYIRCLIVLVAFLHTKHHTSFKACALFLLALNFVLITLPGNLLGGQQMPRTLTTVFSRLQLADKFRLYPICYRYHRIFSGEEDTTLCPDCAEEIYRPRTRQLFQRLFRAGLCGDSDDEDDLGYNPQRTPHLVQPKQLLSNGLRDFFTRPGMVRAVNAWKTRVTVPDELKSIQDGKVWKTIAGPDGTPFFPDDNDDA